MENFFYFSFAPRNGFRLRPGRYGKSKALFLAYFILLFSKGRNAVKKREKYSVFIKRYFGYFFLMF